MRGEEEIEIAPGEPVDAQNGQPLVDILGRLTTRSKSMLWANGSLLHPRNSAK
jgi:hypothetical protein